MPITTEIQFRYSVPSASAGNANAQPTPANSYGKFVSTTVWAGGVDQDLFDNVSESENQNGLTDYRCVFVVNTHATLTLLQALVWLGSVTPGTDLAVGVDPAAASELDSGAVQAAAPANNTTAPAGVTFSSSARSKPTALFLGDIEPGACRAVWIRRTVLDAAPAADRGFTLRVDGASLP